MKLSLSKLGVLSVASLMLMGTAVPVATINAAADTPVVSVEDNSSVQVETEISFSNREFFDELSKNGVNPTDILTEAEYQQALRQDLLRQGSNWAKIYTYQGHKRVSIGVNSAIVKTAKYGGKAAIAALRAVATASGVYVDPGVYYAIQGNLSSINSSKGHWWHINLSPIKIVASGNQ